MHRLVGIVSYSYVCANATYIHHVSFNVLYVGDACFLPVGMFVRGLREQVVERLTNKHPEGLEAASMFIPSDSWISYQFTPKHPPHTVSMDYTGFLNIKHKVQSRTIRASHQYSHYVACIFKTLKRLGVVAAHVINKYTEDDEVPVPLVLFPWTIRSRSILASPPLP